MRVLLKGIISIPKSSGKDVVENQRDANNFEPGATQRWIDRDAMTSK